MAYIHITDLNSSDSRVMEELTDEELLAINGGNGGKGGKGDKGGALSDGLHKLADKIDQFGDKLADAIKDFF